MESLAFSLAYAIPAFGAAIGVGLIGFAGLSAAGRNPEKIGDIRTLMVLAISVGVLGIPLTWGGAIGGVIALGGVVHVVTNGQPLVLLEQGFNRGDLLMVVAAWA